MSKASSKASAGGSGVPGGSSDGSSSQPHRKASKSSRKAVSVRNSVASVRYKVIGIVAVAVVGIIYTVLVGNKPLLGLDLQGGASVVLEPTTKVEQDDLELAVEIIRNRVDGLGVAEPEISTQGGNILVQLPGVENQQRAIDLVGQTAQLRFRPVLGTISESQYQLTLLEVELLKSGLESLEGEEKTEKENEIRSKENIIQQFALTRSRFELNADSANGEVVLASYVSKSEDEKSIDDQDDKDTDAADETPATTDNVDDIAEDNSEELEADAGVEEADAGVGRVETDGVGSIATRYRLGPTEVTGDGLEGANSFYDPINGWQVTVEFRPGADGIDKFNELSASCFYSENVCPTRQTAIEVDNEVLSAPRVQPGSRAFSPFDRSNVTISGDFTQQEARDLALVLDYGALPIELEAQQSQIVSASLGTDALRAGVIAAAIGLAMVSVFLVAYYRLLGFVAIASLMLSGVMLWVIIAWLGESQGLALTLSGVTGMIVAIGVSVDSNVVYFEHLKEEIRSGRTMRSATDKAFPIAFSTIVKADVASLIAAGVLYLLTVGQVRGFALYLGLATILDLVATYFFMGPLITLMAQRYGVNAKLRRFGIGGSSDQSLVISTTSGA